MKLRVRLDEVVTASATIRTSFLMTCFLFSKEDEWQPLAPRSYAYDAVYAERKPEKRLTNHFVRYAYKDMCNIYPRPVYPPSYHPRNLYYRHGLVHRIRRPKSRSNGVIPKAKKMALIYWELYR